MINKPHDRLPLSTRARRYVRGIALAMTLTLAALLFLYATLYGESHPDAYARPEIAPTQVDETGSIGTSVARQ